MNFKKVILLFLSCIHLCFSNSFTKTEKPIINKIFVHGNKHVTDSAILHRLPYKSGNEFDRKLTKQAINNVYSLGHFQQIKILSDKLSGNKIDLYIVLEGKKLLEKIDFKGNKSLKSKTLKEKLNLNKVSTIDKETAQRICTAIQKLYKEENKHLAKVNFTITPNANNAEKVSILFVYKMMIGSCKNNRENYQRKCFRTQEKENRV